MIRAFQYEDIQACADLIESCLLQDANLAPATRKRLTGTVSSLLIQQNSSLLYLAVYDLEGEIAGVGAVDLNEIRLLYVAPELQGRGIGRELLEHLEEMIPSALFSNIFLYSTPSAEGFYKSRGYQSRGEVYFEMEGQSLPTIFMSKPLFAPEPHLGAQDPGGYSPWKWQRRI